MEAVEAAFFPGRVIWVEEFAMCRFHLSWRGVKRLPECCGVFAMRGSLAAWSAKVVSGMPGFERNNHHLEQESIAM
jgi:hypothetical protein